MPICVSSINSGGIRIGPLVCSGGIITGLSTDSKDNAGDELIVKTMNTGGFLPICKTYNQSSYAN